MNYSAMTDLELLHYLDLYSEDPVVRRLIDVFNKSRGEIIAGLESVGMDPKTWTFSSACQDMYPGDYIEELRRDLRIAEEDADEYRYKYEQAKDELNELKTRSIMDFVQEVWQEKQTATYKVEQAMNETKRVAEENTKLREQINMWGKLNHVNQGV